MYKYIYVYTYICIYVYIPLLATTVGGRGGGLRLRTHGDNQQNRRAIAQGM